MSKESPIHIQKMNKYCVVCSQEYGPVLESHCTQNSLVAIKREGVLKKVTRYFSLDGNELTEDEVAKLREVEKEKVDKEREERNRKKGFYAASVIQPARDADTTDG